MITVMDCATCGRNRTAYDWHCCTCARRVRLGLRAPRVGPHPILVAVAAVVSTPIIVSCLRVAVVLAAGAE